MAKQSEQTQQVQQTVMPQGKGSYVAATDVQNADLVVMPQGNERPDPTWIRGRCPECGDDLVSNMYRFQDGEREGYYLAWECWGSLQDTPTCSYRKIL